MARYFRLLAVCWALLGTACATGFSGEVFETDFVGRVESSTGDLQRSDGSGSSGGPTGGVLVGPGTIVLATGETVNVPSHTPGATFCLELGAQEPPMYPCALFGQWTTGGANDSAWYAAEELYLRPDGLYSTNIRLSRVDDEHVRLVFIDGAIHLEATEDLPIEGPCESQRSTTFLVFDASGSEVVAFECRTDEG